MWSQTNYIHLFHDFSSKQIPQFAFMILWNLSYHVANDLKLVWETHGTYWEFFSKIGREASGEKNSLPSAVNVQLQWNTACLFWRRYNSSEILVQQAWPMPGKEQEPQHQNTSSMNTSQHLGGSLTDAMCRESLAGKSRWKYLSEKCKH